ncbi:MAG: hypothetical protein BJ554DRAFT_6172, partial [Olpidium bornovanus]
QKPVSGSLRRRKAQRNETPRALSLREGRNCSPASQAPDQRVCSHAQVQLEEEEAEEPRLLQAEAQTGREGEEKARQLHGHLLPVAGDRPPEPVCHHGRARQGRERAREQEEPDHRRPAGAVQTLQCGDAERSAREE